MKKLRLGDDDEDKERIDCFGLGMMSRKREGEL